MTDVCSDRQRAVSFHPSDTMLAEGPPKSPEIPFEVGHFSDGFLLALRILFLASADNELSLMGRDGYRKHIRQSIRGGC